MASKRLIEEGVIGFNQIQNRPVFSYHMGDKHFGFPLHAKAQWFVKTGKTGRVWLSSVQIAQIEPLARKIIDKCFGLFVFEHPFDLGFQYLGLFQFI